MQRWTTLLWGSRDVATATEAYIKGPSFCSRCHEECASHPATDFVNVVVPMVEDIKTPDDLADARLDLNAFIKVRYRLAMTACE
jgi:hypothetical protein